MSFLLVTVTDGSADSQANLAALLESLGRQEADVDLVLVQRGDCPAAAPPSARVRIHPVGQPLRVSLSAARNAALDAAAQLGLLATAGVVAFPDDDCRYPDGLLARVGARVAAGADVVCGPYGPSASEVDHGRFPREEQPLRPRLIMQALSSNNMFFSRRAAHAVGRFDERLGLGARWGASEDADFALRALAQGFAGVYAPGDVLVEHPYKSHRPSQYYVGNVAVLAKHARAGNRTRVLLARRLAGGLLLAGRRKIAAAEYGTALRATWALLAS